MVVNSRRPPKNIWDMICLPIGVATAWYLFSEPIFMFRQIGMPADAFLASNASELSVLLFFLGVGFVALGPGLMLSNFILWTVPFTRRQQDRLNDGHGDLVFKQANKGLQKFSVALIIFLYPLSFLAGLNYFALSPTGVFYRPWFAAHAIHYEWRQITGISTACYSDSKHPIGRYIIWFNDGRDIDLNAFSTRDFFANYQTISKYLNGIPFNFYFDEQMSKTCPQSWLPYFQKSP
jgi:hypothetical protein